MKILLLGPPGAGRSTQAQRLSEKLNYLPISTGDMIRAQMIAGTELGRRIESYYGRGELVPDEAILELVLPNLEPSGRWVLDGFPRTEAQARALDAALERRGIGLSRAILLEAPDEDVISRVVGRRYSLTTGRVYHVEQDPPPDFKARQDEGPFMQREDDTEDAIRRQLEIYHREASILTGYYEGKGILATVDARKTIPEVTESILEALQTPRKS